MSKDLGFRSLRLQNWKNFSHVEVAIQDRVFLVGPNASGKSNFLDVFRFLRDLASTGGGFQKAIGDRGGVSAIRSLAARRYPDVEIRVEIGRADAGFRWVYELAFHQDNQGRPLVRQERVLRDGEELLNRPSIEDRNDPARLTQTSLEQVNLNQPFRDLATFFASVRYLHIVPQLVREPDRSVGRSNDPFGGDFLEQVAKTQERTRNARLRRKWKANPAQYPLPGAPARRRDWARRGADSASGNRRHRRHAGELASRDSRPAARRIEPCRRRDPPDSARTAWAADLVRRRLSVSGPVIISAAVEGIVDEAVVQKLITNAGGQPGAVYGKNGKTALRQKINGYNNAARHAPWVVLVDLDREAECAPPPREAWLPEPAPDLCFRVAVREIEAWLMADPADG